MDIARPAAALAIPTGDGGMLIGLAGPGRYVGGRIVEFNAKGEIVHQLKNLPWLVTSVALMMK